MQKKTLDINALIKTMEKGNEQLFEISKQIDDNLNFIKEVAFKELHEEDEHTVKESPKPLFKEGLKPQFQPSIQLYSLGEEGSLHKINSILNGQSLFKQDDLFKKQNDKDDDLFCGCSK